MKTALTTEVDGQYHLHSLSLPYLGVRLKVDKSLYQYKGTVHWPQSSNRQLQAVGFLAYFLS